MTPPSPFPTKLVRATFVQLPMPLLAGTMLFGLGGVGLARAGWLTPGLWLLRAVSPLGALAAVSRVVDGALTVPKNAHETVTMTRRVILGLVAFLLFSVALISGGSLGNGLSSYLLVVQTLGVLVLVTAAIRRGRGRAPAANVLVFRAAR